MGKPTCFFCKKKLLDIDFENGLAFEIVGPNGELLCACAHHPGVENRVRVTGLKVKTTEV